MKIKVKGLDGKDVELTVKQNTLEANHKLIPIYRDIKMNAEASIAEAVGKEIIKWEVIERHEKPMRDNRKARAQNKEIIEQGKEIQNPDGKTKDRLKKAKQDLDRQDKGYAKMLETYEDDYEAWRMKSLIDELNSLAETEYFMKEGVMKDYVGIVCEGDLDRINFSDFNNLAKVFREARQSFLPGNGNQI